MDEEDVPEGDIVKTYLYGLLAGMILRTEDE